MSDSISLGKSAGRWSLGPHEHLTKKRGVQPSSGEEEGSRGVAHEDETVRDPGREEVELEGLLWDGRKTKGSETSAHDEQRGARKELTIPEDGRIR